MRNCATLAQGVDYYDNDNKLNIESTKNYYLCKRLVTYVSSKVEQVIAELANKSGTKSNSHLGLF